MKVARRGGGWRPPRKTSPEGWQGPRIAFCRAFAVAVARQLRLDAVRRGPTMQPREAVPLWVGLTLGLMIIGAGVYLTGYFVIEDFLAFFK
jgi:hypothetical protein